MSFLNCALFFYFYLWVHLAAAAVVANPNEDGNFLIVFSMFVSPYVCLLFQDGTTPFRTALLSSHCINLATKNITSQNLRYVF